MAGRGPGSSEHLERLHEIFRGLHGDLRGVPERLRGSAAGEAGGKAGHAAGWALPGAVARGPDRPLSPSLLLGSGSGRVWERFPSLLPGWHFPVGCPTGSWGWWQGHCRSVWDVSPWIISVLQPRGQSPCEKCGRGGEFAKAVAGIQCVFGRGRWFCCGWVPCVLFFI